MKTLILSLYWICYVSSQKIAHSKCQEYGRAVYQHGDKIFSLRNRGLPQLFSTCALYENPLIVGGTPARNREFPHMALIGFAPTEYADMDWLCGGSLISEKHVLTAAHCTISRSGPPQKVRLGSINIEEHDDYVQEVVIDTFLKHPEYKRPKKYHDIAIIFLRYIVIFSAFVRPACLNTYKDIWPTKATATGFGKTSHQLEERSNILLKVDLDIIPTDLCNTFMRFRKAEMPENITERMLCAGDLQGGRDTCQGDSGGPLQVILREPYCMYSIIGITSFGRFCGLPYSPGIYTKVDQYINWIEFTIWK